MIDIVFGMDGDQHFAHRPDFVNLQESLCGFGDTEQEALDDLRGQELEQEEV